MKRAIAIYALIAGFLYLISAFFTIPKDVFGGLMLFIISAVYLYGGRKEFDGKGLSFVTGAVFLSVVYGLLYLSIVIADFLEFLIGNLDEFSLLSELRLEIWLFIFVIPLIYLVWKEVRKLKW